MIFALYCPCCSSTLRLLKEKVLLGTSQLPEIHPKVRVRLSETIKFSVANIT